MNLKIILPLMLILSVGVYQQAFGTSTEKYPLIMIIPSETCSKIIQYHLNTDCPTDNQLIKYDTSNQKISGKFITKNNVTTRTQPQIKNHYQFYNSQTVCVDCYGNLASPDLFKTIILEPHGFTWIDKSASVGNNRIWDSFSDRHMAGCNTATIAYSDSLLNDTISYMESECTKTSFNGTKTNIIQDHPFSWNNPYSTMHYQGLVTKIKSTGGLTNCINIKCSYKDPNAKW